MFTASEGLTRPVGPLLWHWENNSAGDTSVELSLGEVKELARKIGFEISVRTKNSSSVTREPV